MAKQESKSKLHSYETQLNSANNIPHIDAVVSKTSNLLLTTASGVHMTQAYSDQLTQLASKLEDKKNFLEEERNRLADENTQLTAQNIQLTASNTQSIANFDADIAGLSSAIVTGFPASYSSVIGLTLPALRPVPYTPASRPDDMDRYGHVITGSGRRNYDAALREARSLYASLQQVFTTIRTAEATVATNTTKITNNTTSLGNIVPITNRINTRIADIQDILSKISGFVGLDGTDCQEQMKGNSYETFDDLLTAGTTGASFELRQGDGTPLPIFSLGGHNYYQIQLILADGKKLTRLIRQSDLTIHTTTGRITLSANLQIYDQTGTVYVPPQGQVQFDLHPTVAIVSATTPPITLYHTKRLQVNRSMNVANQASVLSNPAFTTELTSRMGIAYRQHVQAFDRADSQIYKTIRTYLDSHPEYASLPDYQKTELYHRVLGLTEVTVGTPPTVRSLFGGVSLANAITPTQIWNTALASLSDHAVLFASYVQGKHVEPKPSADELSSEVKYRNWLSRNLKALTQNYIAHSLSTYLDEALVTQAVNETVTEYATNYETQKTTPLATAQLQTAAVSLRQCLPQSYGSSNINNSWMRLMAGKGASISDSIDNEDGTNTNYTTAVQMRTGKGVSVNVVLGDEKPIILAGATPGDILAKILTGCGGRVDGDRERMMLAFSTMKAIVKTCKEAGVHMTVPVNGTNGDELRVSLDDKDNIRVARYNYNADTDSFEESSTPGDVFDEMNPDHKHRMTPDFLVNMNRVTNTMLNNQYAQFRGTMNDATSTLNNFARFMIFDRERMSYKANPRWLRGVITKLLNRKENPMQEFSFPVQTGNKTANVTYNPNGTITIEVDGKVRKGKNLAKLLNPWSFRTFGGIFARQKNMTDGLEMGIMQGLYEGLSGQLMDNSRVNTYTYLVRDPRTQIVYGMYQDDDGKTQMGIIENVSRNIGPIENTRHMIGYADEIPLLPSQNRGRCKGMPPQGIRQLSDEERAAVMARPEIMDGFMQNMLKAREEIISVGVGKYRRASLTAMVAGQLGTAVAIGGIDMMSGGLLTSGAYTAGQAVNSAVVGGAPSLGSATKSVLSNTATALKKAYEIPLNFAAGVIGK